MIYTNGSTWRDYPGGPIITRQFKKIAEYKDHAWVEALNGNYIGEFLTFHISALKEYKND